MVEDTLAGSSVREPSPSAAWVEVVLCHEPVIWVVVRALWLRGGGTRALVDSGAWRARFN